MKDAISPRLSSALNSRIHIRQAIPVLVDTAHRQLHVWTADYRVSAVLHHLLIKLGPRDTVKPSLSSLVGPRSTITVIRRWWEHKTTTVSLPFDVVHQADAQLAEGQSKVIRQGQAGLERLVKSTLMNDGKPQIERTQAQVLRQAIPEIIAYGTQRLVSRGGQVAEFVRKIMMVATAYWPDPSWSTGITSTGIRAQFGVAAVDPSVIPLGTHLYIPGYGPAIAADTGGAIVGDRIDLCFNYGYQAVDWGVRSVTVYVLANGSL
jgi:3D (Asp-Asp-Asp) domain-containing protein